MKRFCLALDLKDNPKLIGEYEQWHSRGNVWPEIIESIYGSGITNMEIFRTGNRLFMIIEAQDNFSLDDKAALDAANPKVQEWEKLMSNFQEPLPWSRVGEKWIPMKNIFSLNEHKSNGPSTKR